MGATIIPTLKVVVGFTVHLEQCLAHKFQPLLLLVCSPLDSNLTLSSSLLSFFSVFQIVNSLIFGPPSSPGGPFSLFRATSCSEMSCPFYLQSVQIWAPSSDHGTQMLILLREGEHNWCPSWDGHLLLGGKKCWFRWRWYYRRWGWCICIWILFSSGWYPHFCLN